MILITHSKQLHWSMDFIPKSDGLAAVDLERRIMSSLPHIAYMVSRPRQDIDKGEANCCNVSSTGCCLDLITMIIEEETLTPPFGTILALFLSLVGT